MIPTAFSGIIAAMMTEIIGWFYTAVLAALSLYAVHIAVLIGLYFCHRREALSIPPLPPETMLPWVTVQLPLRNERYVVQRVLRAIAALDWPRDRLEIQILDDSDDETTALAAAEVARLREQGYTVQLLHRVQPRGYKAGALAAGLKQARGELIALFDADFCPAPDFLRQVVPHLLADAGLGMVQARWSHLNAEYSAITRAQALALDAHFTVEHIARNRGGLLMNFNGTAGVWRKAAIEAAGGWQADTVAEDLDLSYRAQLCGWRVRYLPEVTAAAELPPLVAAFKQQQYRWAKGAAQCLRKLAGPILRSPRLSPGQKLMALLHLSGYLTQPLFLLLILLALPMTFYRPPLPPLSGVLGAIIAIPPLLYLIGQITLYRDWPRRILAYPVLMALGMGLAWSNTLALLDGFLHWGGPFQRTPKFRLQAREGSWQHACYRLAPDRATLGEVLLGLYALTTAWQAWLGEQEQLLPLVFIAISGQLLMVGATLLQARVMRG